ncbi:MAG TPA: ABC transporter permease [Steroidobacteraceae bacterium]|nr:ABC transporter permease [Steroidobacteraceae bacterium]
MMLLNELRVASRVGFKSLRQRIGSALVIVAGMACVVGVTLAMLSLAAGIARAIQAGGDASHALVHAAESATAESNGLSRADIPLILNAPGIAVAADGRPLASAEVALWLPPAEGFAEGTLYLQGIGPKGAAVRPGFAIVSGRMFRTGAQEIIVGRGAESVFGLKVGSTVIMPNGEWPIVGEFTDHGNAVESELMADADTVTSAAAIPAFGSVLVALRNPAAFTEFKRWLTTNPALAVSVERHSDYLARTAGSVTQFLATLAYFVGGLMAMGAVFGSIQIMYSAVESRTIEIATLRAVGYEPLPIAVSVVLEAALLSLLGALLGATLAWLFFNGTQSFSGSTVFRMQVSGRMVALGLVWAIGLAIVGGLAPAIRAARLPVAEALRST